MKKDTLIMALTTLVSAVLVFVTWTQIAISRWIVGHSGVEDMMQSEGKHTELFFKDVFFHMGTGILLAEVAVVGILLWLLWRRLYRDVR